MLEAAASAQWGHPAPEELQMAWDCQRWNTLPDGMSLMDQPAGLIHRMNIALNVYNAFDSRQSADIHADWAKNNPRANKIVAHVERMRFDRRKQEVTP
jgi:hypothetical protein